ncbi:hypothetical protein Tco_0053023 [Tanacetum coccineum]
MRELREDTFFGNKNDDAHEHVERVLDIISLFNIPGVSHDAVMLRIFPITLTGAAKRWVDRLSLGTVDSWDHLKNAFIQRNINSSSNSEGIAAIVNKLDFQGRDIKKLKENVHAIQVGCQTYKGDHLDKECPLNKEVKSIEEARLDTTHTLTIDNHLEKKKARLRGASEQTPRVVNIKKSRDGRVGEETPGEWKD